MYREKILPCTSVFRIHIPTSFENPLHMKHLQICKLPQTKWMGERAPTHSNVFAEENYIKTTGYGKEGRDRQNILQRQREQLPLPS